MIAAVDCDILFYGRTSFCCAICCQTNGMTIFTGIYGCLQVGIRTSSILAVHDLPYAASQNYAAIGTYIIYIGVGRIGIITHIAVAAGARIGSIPLFGAGGCGNYHIVIVSMFLPCLFSGCSAANTFTGSIPISRTSNQSNDSDFFIAIPLATRKRCAGGSAHRITHNSVMVAQSSLFPPKARQMETAPLSRCVDIRFARK